MERLRGLKASARPERSAKSEFWREDSASYPPLNSTNMQQGGPASLQAQLQALQLQLQQQSSGLQQQPRVPAVGNPSAASAAMNNSTGMPVTGMQPLCVLLVANDPSLAIIFQQVLPQAQTPFTFFSAAPYDMWSMIEQIKAVTGKQTGPDIVFFQPDVLVANPGTATRMKQACSAACVIVVLQATESIGRVLQADDFLPGPSPGNPLRRDDLTALFLRWRSRQQSTGTSSTASSVGSINSTQQQQVQQPLPQMTPMASFAQPGMVSSGPQGLTRVGTGLPNTGGAPLNPGQAAATPQAAQLQQLQAQLAALQQAKLAQAQAGGAGGVATIGAGAVPRSMGSGMASDMESLPATMQSQLGRRTSPPQRPPPLRLASAGVTPSDAHPESLRSLSRTSTPAPSGTGHAGGAPDVQDLVAQVAELRRRLGEKSRTASMRSPSISSTGVTPAATMLRPPSPAGSNASVNGPAGQPAPMLSQRLPSLPSADLQLKLQELQQQQQMLMQRLASSNSIAAQRTRSPSPPGRTSSAYIPAADVGSAATAPRLGLQNHGSLARPAAVTAAMSTAGFPAPGTPPTPQLQGSQALNTQLQQQLMQLQQLQLQLQQQLLARGVAPPATAAAAPVMAMSPFAAADMSLSARPSNLSPNGSLASPGSGQLPSPSLLLGAAEATRGTAAVSADSNSVSRSNSFVAAGGTRYRPPRQRSPSPLSGIGGGHMSDGFAGPPSTSRFNSTSPLRSTSGGGHPSGGGGTGSGYASDSGPGHDGGAASGSGMRESGRNSMLSKSGDDAIAAALEAEEQAQEEAEHLAERAALGGAAAVEGLKVADLAADLDAGDGGSSSADGRSVMDASLALEDSGGAGRGSLNGANRGGSLSGGGASSIDLQPNPKREVHSPKVSPLSSPASSPPPTATEPSARAAAAVAPPASARAASPRSTAGALAVGAHRLPSVASLAETDQQDEEEAPLQVGPSRRHTVAVGDSTAVPAGRPSSPPPVVQKLVTLDSWSQTVEPLAPPLAADDSVRMASPDANSGKDSPVAAAAPAATGAEALGSTAVEPSLPPVPASAIPPAVLALGRVESLGGTERLPSIDGSKPLAPVVTLQAAAAGPAEGGADSSGGSVSLSPKGAVLPPAPQPNDFPGSPTVSSARSVTGSAGAGFAEGRSREAAGFAAATGEGINLTASIEGSIAAESVPAGRSSPQQSQPAARISGSGSIEGAESSTATSPPPPINFGGLSAAAAATPASSSSYTDDIFTMLPPLGRELDSPAPLAPPRSSTPPARRLARILMSSHPIVITREDFLPS